MNKIIEKLEKVSPYMFWRCYLGFWGLLIYTVLIIVFVKMMG